MNTLKNIDKQVKQIEESAEESKIATSLAPPQQTQNPVFYSPQVPLSGNVRQHMDLFGLKPKPTRPFIIGVCGGSSSGKSTVANMIKTKLKNQPKVINLLDFYLPVRGNLRRKSSIVSGDGATAAHDSGSKEDEERIQKEITEIDKHYDFDVPSAIDWDLLIKGLELLREGKPFNKPLYDEHLKLRREETEKVIPGDLIVIEGHLLFTNQQVMDLLDLKVFIDTDDDVRLSRRVLKMSKQTGSLASLQDLLYKYEKQIKPAYEKYIEPTKKYADIIIPNYGFSMDSMDLNELMIPIPAVELIIKQAESLGRDQKKARPFF